MPFEGLDELEEELPVEQPDLGLGGGDPEAIAAARRDRDEKMALANIMQGISDAGVGAASQGRIKPDNAVFDAIRANAATKGKEAISDATLRQKRISDFIKQQNAAKRQAISDSRDARDFDQRERGIEATRSDKEFQRNKPTDANSLAAGYGRRMEQAEGIFDELKGKGYNRADKTSAIESAIAGLPVVGDVAAATMQSENSKRQEQAELNFLSAVLRRESGASIAPSEHAKGAKQYFPRVGDTPELLEQKRQNRAQAKESLKSSAGPAWAQTPSVSGGGGGFPRQVRKNGKVATVKNEAELGEAASEGWQ